MEILTCNICLHYNHYKKKCQLRVIEMHFQLKRSQVVVVSYVKENQKVISLLLDTAVFLYSLILKSLCFKELLLNIMVSLCIQKSIVAASKHIQRSKHCLFWCGFWANAFTVSSLPNACIALWWKINQEKWGHTKVTQSLSYFKYLNIPVGIFYIPILSLP